MPLISRVRPALSKYNAYVQPTEPSKKEGIWIQTSQKYPVKNVIAQSNFITGGAWAAEGALASPTNVGKTVHRSVEINGKVYFLMSTMNIWEGEFSFSLISYDSNTNIYSYSYPTLINKYGLKFTPSFTVISMAAYNGQIFFYIQGKLEYSSVDSSFRIVYNPATNTVSTFTTSAINYSDQWSTVSYGFLGQNKNQLYYLASRYDTYSRSFVSPFLLVKNIDTDTISQQMLSVEANNAWTCTGTYLHGKLIYTGAFMDNNFSPIGYTPDLNRLLVLDLATNTAAAKYTPNPTRNNTLSSTNCWQLICSYENNAYIDGRSLSSYNIMTDTFSTITMPSFVNTDYNPNYRILSQVKGQLVMLNAHNVPGPYIDAYVFQRQSLANGTLALLAGGEYSANVDRKSTAYFNDAWWYDFSEYPTYIGNGSTWTKIKN